MIIYPLSSRQFGNCLLAFLFLCAACRSKPGDAFLIPVKTAADADDWVMQVDSIRIPVPVTCNKSYYAYSTYEAGGQDHLIAFNSRNGGSLDLFNLTTRKFEKQLMLSSDSLFADIDAKDQDKNRSVADIHAFHADSILVNYGNKLLITIDTAFHRKSLVNLDTFVRHTRLPALPITYSNYFRLLPFRGELLFSLVYFKGTREARRPQVISCNMQQQTVTPLPVYFSDYYYHIGAQTGFLGQISSSQYQKDSLLTFNYLYESNIYQYDPRDSTITAYGAGMKEGSNIVTPFVDKDPEDLKAWEVHNMENSNFFHVMYDRYRRLYYRFSLREIAYRNGKYFNSMLEKPVVLMVFNERFEVIKEITLPQYVYAANTWFVTREGLFVSPKNEKREYNDPHHLHYHIFKFHQKTRT